MDWFEMNCREVLNELELYVDGELSPAERGEVAQHLTECPECLDHQEFRRRLQAIVRRACGTAELPPGLVERIRSAISRPD